MMIRRLPLLLASIIGTYGSLSRWWFMLQLVQSGWSNQGGPGPGDTVAVIVSGTEGGSAETNHPGGSTKAYIPKMINLLARTLPFKIEVVCESGTFEPFYAERDHFTKTGSGQT
jgi:hypothetical protein